MKLFYIIKILQDFLKLFEDYLFGKTKGVKRENDCYVGGFANYLSNDYSILGVIINTVCL